MRVLARPLEGDVQQCVSLAFTVMSHRADAREAAARSPRRNHRRWSVIGGPPPFADVNDRAPPHRPLHKRLPEAERVQLARAQQSSALVDRTIDAQHESSVGAFLALRASGRTAVGCAGLGRARGPGGQECRDSFTMERTRRSVHERLTMQRTPPPRARASPCGGPRRPERERCGRASLHGERASGAQPAGDNPSDRRGVIGSGEA